jgi:hypothetical protein
MEFHYLQAPHDPPEPPIQALLDRGFKLPFGAWIYNGDWGSKQSELEVADISYGLEESILAALKMMKAQGPFDGMLAFSQGSIFFRHFYRIVHSLDPDSYAEYFSDASFKFPSFIISICSPYFPKMILDYKG